MKLETSQVLVDFKARQARRNGLNIALTAREFEILETLVLGFLLLPTGILFVGLVFLVSQGVHTAPEQLVFAATLLGCLADVCLLRWFLSRAHRTSREPLITSH